MFKEIMVVDYMTGETDSTVFVGTAEEINALNKALWRQRFKENVRLYPETTDRSFKLKGEYGCIHIHWISGYWRIHGEKVAMSYIMDANEENIVWVKD